MTIIQKALLLASAMLLTALAAAFGLLPPEAAEFAPFGWLVLYPWVIGSADARCDKGCRA